MQKYEQSINMNLHDGKPVPAVQHNVVKRARHEELFMCGHNHPLTHTQSCMHFDAEHAPPPGHECMLQHQDANDGMDCSAGKREAEHARTWMLSTPLHQAMKACRSTRDANDDMHCSARKREAVRSSDTHRQARKQAAWVRFARVMTAACRDTLLMCVCVCVLWAHRQGRYG
eukprot:1159516-Pelagomonas_calceolata.AAC.10